MTFRSRARGRSSSRSRRRTRPRCPARSSRPQPPPCLTRRRRDPDRARSQAPSPASTRRAGVPAGRRTRTATSGRRTSSRRVNTSIGIFSKTDGARVAAFTFNPSGLARAPGTLCDTRNGGDPTVVYDPLGDRWIVADFAFTGSGNAPPYYECIAVSKTGDPVAGGWYFYADPRRRRGASVVPGLPEDGHLAGRALHDGQHVRLRPPAAPARFKEVRAWAFNRDDLESGATAAVRRRRPEHHDLLQPAAEQHAPVAGAPPAGRTTSSSPSRRRPFALQVFKFHVDYSGSGSTFTGPTNVSQRELHGRARQRPRARRTRSTRCASD